jgi:selenium-binding protein 1
MQLRPDPTFYPSAKLAMEAPREQLAYVALLAVDGHERDALAVVDCDPQSARYGRTIAEIEMPAEGDELHHFGWNACSSALCPYAPHPHVERRYLIVTGLRSSRIYILDTKPDPTRPRIVKTVEAEEVVRRSGYTRLHTTHCGPEGIYISALGDAEGKGPGGVLLLDHDDFKIVGRWESDRGPQYLAYDFFWHLGHDVMVSSEWGTPEMIENGVVPELLLGGKYGHQLHFWDLRKHKHLASVDLGAEHQMALELRPSHDPTKAYGFVNSVVTLKDLSSAIWVWQWDGKKADVTKVIEIPAEPAAPEQLPPLLQGFKAVPPLVTDIDLSLDDRFLYVSCWGTGELRQYDVSDPWKPTLTGSVHLGGIVRRAEHPARPGEPRNGGPQMVEISRDGRRVYFTNSLYRSWDAQFYPDGIDGWMVKLDAGANGGITLDKNFYVTFGSRRPHQVRLQGGDASSDSYCYPP